MSKEAGQSIRIKCVFRGHPLPSVRWLKNEAPIDEVQGRIAIRTEESSGDRIVSRLKIIHLDIHDTGYYKCEASNKKKTLETVGILVVRAGK